MFTCYPSNLQCICLHVILSNLQCICLYVIITRSGTGILLAVTIIYQYFEIFVREQVNNVLLSLTNYILVNQHFSSPILLCTVDLSFPLRAKWAAWVPYSSKSPPPTFATTVRLNFLSGRLQIVLAQILNNYKIPF